MASEEPSQDEAGRRDSTRVLLVACCLLAIGLAGVLVPAVTGGVVDSPAESLVPGDAIDSAARENLGQLSSAGLGDVSPGELGANGSGSGFGALNPGKSTQVGGPTGVSDTAFSSQSTSVHFTVRSSQPAYWRTGAYDEYTGSGWEQTGGTDSFDGTVGTQGLEGQRVEYEVELNRSATALPTVWQPNSVDGVSDLELTDQRAVRAGDRLGAGTTYTGVSHKPPEDPTVLRASGRDYPSDVRERYTQLPEDTPDRLSRFTTSLTEDANSPYEEAVAIEQWLESNKNYSLEASQTSDHMADTFVFEMQAGYCEYFATSMVAMLRTQDIPARYVVGYSTGQQVGENTYKVRGMNAHAWVEVYFEDVGWVKFDPTPGSARLQQEQQSIQQEQPQQNYSPTEQGSPGETFSPDGGTNSSGSSTTDPGEPTTENTSGETDSGYVVALNRTAVPGTAVTVTVTQGGELQSGVTVLFDGDPIGQTGDDGTVVGTVPYTEQLNVTVRGDAMAALVGTGPTPGGPGNRFYSGRTRGDAASIPQRPANLTVPVETNISVAITGERTPGATVTVTATIDGVPVRNGTVTVDGTEAATTDENGRAEVSLPDDGGNVTIAVERGALRGNRTVRLPVLNVSVDPTTPIALPGTEAVVTVTADGDPVAGATVSIDGEQVATTGVNGTATVTLPFAGSATVQASDGAATAEATVRNLYLNLGGVVGGLLTIVIAVFALAYHYGYTPREVLGLVVSLPGLAVRYSQWLLVTVATRWDDLLAMAATRLRRTGAYLRDLLRGRVTLDDLRAALVAWVEERRGSPAAAEAPDATVAASDGHSSIRRAWRRFLGYVSLRRPETKTPGEIARHAVARDDLPTRPVRVLRDTFREVEYGARPADQHTEQAQQAVEAIESATEDEDGGEE